MPRMKRSVPLYFLLACLSFAAASASASDKKVKYEPSPGFAGHKWGELRSSFDRLPTEPIGVGAAWMRALEKTQDFTCVPLSGPGATMNGAVEGCDFQATLL